MTSKGKELRRIGNIRDIDEEKITRVGVDGKSVLLIKKDGEMFAIDSICGEGCGPLEDGILEGFHIRCPWYHEYYDIRTGKPFGVTHCSSSIKTYETRVNETNGDIFLYVEVNG
ncbi:MAG: nitrite reductase (NAD(P)H) small subunit [Thaumarchaeota archaeon]|nr:nitrite reductase (NAD(P)H) small subunit [Nitrososphaerota archaeon]